MNHVVSHSETALLRRPPARNTGISRAEHSAYLARIREFPVLSEREEHRLIRGWYENGERQAYDALIGSHLRLVPKIAQKYSGYGVPLADLIGEGNLGLLQSAERFDPEKGFRFSTYARWWIKAAMLNYVLQTWSLIKVGNGAAKKRLFFNLRRAKQNLQADGDRYLDDKNIDTLAKHFQVSREDLVAMDQRMTAIDVSLHQPVPGSEGLTFGDVIADTSMDAEALLAGEDEQNWHVEILNDALERLDRREKDIVRQRYLSEEPMTLASIATAYGLTAERVRQIEAKAIGKLRRYIGPRTRYEVCGHA
ncbi:MAG: RNA polymerase factor sigma-32 [Rhodospirillaceae bacterium]